jgi:hypothetical protein
LPITYNIKKQKNNKLFITNSRKNDVKNAIRIIIDRANSNETFKNFKNETVPNNTVRVPYILIKIKRYNFIDTKTNNQVTSSYFTFTDGLAVFDNPDQKGITIKSFSITDAAVHNKFVYFKEPGVFCYIEIGKRYFFKSIDPF